MVSEELFILCFFSKHYLQDCVEYVKTQLITYGITPPCCIYIVIQQKVKVKIKTFCIYLYLVYVDFVNIFRSFLFCSHFFFTH